MSARKDAMAREKQRLLDRSALSRGRLHQDSRAVRDALRWPRIAASTAPSIGRLAGGLALAVVAAGPLARVVALGTRVILYARLVRSVIGLFRAGTRQA